jgi:hypothetical protein
VKRDFSHASRFTFHEKSKKPAKSLKASLISYYETTRDTATTTTQTAQNAADGFGHAHAPFARA